MKFLDKSGLTQVWDAINDRFQPKLVSGTNIKTINNQSILGEGNLVAGETDTWVGLKTYEPTKQFLMWNGYININPNDGYIYALTQTSESDDPITPLPYFRLSTQDGLAFGEWMADGPATIQYSVYGPHSIIFWSGYPGNAIATYDTSGVTLSGKTENDLLNAAGGTISIDDLKSQIGGGDYLPLSGGTVSGNVTLMGNGGRIINNVSPNPYLGVQDSAGYTTLNPSEVIIASGNTNMQVLTVDHSHQDEYAAPLSEEEILAILV